MTTFGAGTSRANDQFFRTLSSAGLKSGVLKRAKSGNATARKEPLVNKPSEKNKAKREGKFNQPVQSAGGGQVKRARASGAKATRAKSVLSNNPSDDKLG